MHAIADDSVSDIDMKCVSQDTKASSLKDFYV